LNIVVVRSAPSSPRLVVVLPAGVLGSAPLIGARCAASTSARGVTPNAS
jgi:hypothetical protein